MRVEFINGTASKRGVDKGKENILWRSLGAKLKV